MTHLITILGTYFPSFAGIIAPPLWGTRVFPLMANQEKLHFVVATDGQLDRFDGTPEATYMEEVKSHMTKLFRGWDKRPESFDWLQLESTNHSRDFRKKFPFAVERLDQRCFKPKDTVKIKVKVGAVKYINTPAGEHRPAAGSRTVTASTRPVRQDPRRSENELRQAQVS